jgi:hypothetical protein
MNILLTTALKVGSGPLVSAAVADQVLKAGGAPAGGFVRDSIIAKNGTRKLAAKRSPAMI